jgi:hypothetical protein
MRMTGFPRRSIAFSTGVMRGRLAGFIADRVHQGRSACTSLTCCRSYKHALYLPLGRLLIRL